MSKVFICFFALIAVSQMGSSKASPTVTKTEIEAENNTRANPGDIYYPSINNAQWDEGKRDCANKGYIGLAEIHKKDELYLIKSILDDNADIAASYWVGAKYVPSLRKFRWTESNEVVGDWLDEEWEVDYPGDTMNNQTALQLKYTIDGKWKFRTGVTSHNARYLCEGRITWHNNDT